MLEQNFNAIFSSLLDQWFRFSIAMVGNKEDAEDIVQEALIKLWKRKNKMSEVKNIKAYSLQVVKNLCYDKINKKKSTFSFDTKKHDINYYSIEDEIYAKEEIAIIIKLLEKLPNRQKEIFILKDMEGCTYNEIKIITNLEISNIRANLSMARKKIKELFNNSIKDGK